MPLTATEKELLNEKFKGIELLLEEKFKNVEMKLNTIETQVTKTNGRVNGHDNEIKKLQGFNWKIAGIWMGASTVITLILAFVKTFL